MTHWQDMIVGDRMTVDSEFSPRVESSRFSRQEWSLIMTATTFEIERPEDEANAKIVADTSQLSSMMPEIQKVAEMEPMSPGGGRPDSGGGLFGSIRDALGLGGGGGSGDEKQKIADAEALVAAYADTLQAHLESEGRWSEVCAAAATE